MKRMTFPLTLRDGNISFIFFLFPRYFSLLLAQYIRPRLKTNNLFLFLFCFFVLCVFSFLRVLATAKQDQKKNPNKKEQVVENWGI